MATKQPQEKMREIAKQVRNQSSRVAWHRNLGISYAVYDHEEDYVSPATIEEGRVEILRDFTHRLAMNPLFVDET